jgi:hypothetical protein
MARVDVAPDTNRSFSALLRQVAQGKRFTVHSHGRPVANLLLTEDLHPGSCWRGVCVVNPLVVQPIHCFCT